VPEWREPKKDPLTAVLELLAHPYLVVGFVGFGLCLLCA